MIDLFGNNDQNCQKNFAMLEDLLNKSAMVSAVLTLQLEQLAGRVRKLEKSEGKPKEVVVNSYLRQKALLKAGYCVHLFQDIGNGRYFCNVMAVKNGTKLHSFAGDSLQDVIKSACEGLGVDVDALAV